jgi:hypothetical protein
MAITIASFGASAIQHRPYLRYAAVRQRWSQACRFWRGNVPGGVHLFAYVEVLGALCMLAPQRCAADHSSSTSHGHEVGTWVVTGV